MRKLVYLRAKSIIMKTLKPIVLSIAIAISTFSYGQTSENPWAIAVGADLINLQGDNVDSGLNFGAPALSLSRYIGAGFSIGAQYALNNVENNNEELKYSSIDGIVKYNLTEGKILPYLFAGYGFSKFADGTEKDGFFPSTETNRTGLGGIGVNFYLDDNFAINVSTSYRGNLEGDTYNHLQHIVGLSYNFGAGDADKDGVPDQKDVCPDIPGLKEFDGCPDTDGDGIGDVGILSSDDENLDEYVKGPDELVMLRRVNVSDQMEVLLLGSLGANVPVRDDDSRPARDKAKETFARKAAREALGRQEKERRSKSRRLN